VVRGPLPGAIVGWISVAQVSDSSIWKILGAVAGAWLSNRVYSKVLFPLYLVRREGRVLPIRTPRAIRQFDRRLIAARISLRYSRSKSQSAERALLFREVLKEAARQATLAGWGEANREDISYRERCKGPRWTTHLQDNWASVLDGAREGVAEGMQPPNRAPSGLS
jgi:hypothetical protein